MTDMRFLDYRGTRLAYRYRRGQEPTLVFLPGFMSDMTGTKAEALEEWAVRIGQAFLRLDYSGCGASEGRFEDGTISRWRDDAWAVIETVTPGSLVLIGSSMGGWIALLLAVAHPDRVMALVGIAAAPDFTDWGLLASFDDHQRAGLARDEQLTVVSDYGDAPYIYTKALIDDGQTNRVLQGPISYDGPVRLLHGQADPDVPWKLAFDIADRLGSSDVQIHMIKDGDHRLSRPQDLALLTATIDLLLRSLS